MAVAREVIHVVAMHDADGAGNEIGPRARPPSARLDRGPQAHERLRDPRIAPADEAPRLALDVALVEGLEVGPRDGARIENEAEVRNGRHVDVSSTATLRFRFVKTDCRIAASCIEM